MADTQYDGSIRIDTRIDTNSFNAGMAKVNASARRATGQVAQSITSGLSKAVSGVLTGVLTMVRRLALGFFGLVSALAIFGDSLINKLEKSLDTQSAYYAQLQALRHEFYRVQAAVFSIFSTLLQAALPTIIRLVDWLVRMLEILNQIIAALFGQKTVMRAVASSVKATADAAGKNAKNNEKAKKAAQQMLAAFDQIDVLRKKDDLDAGAGAGGGGVGGGGFQFEEVPIDSQWIALADKIRTAFFTAIEAIKNIWLGFVAIWNAFWNSPLGQLIQTLWKNFVDTWKKIWENTKETWAKIDEGIKKVITGIGTFIKGVINGDWRQAWQGIVQIVQGVWDIISGFVIGTLKNILIFFGGWKNAIIAIWEFLRGVWQSVWSAIQAIAVGAFNTIKSFWSDLSGWFQRTVIDPLRNAFAVGLDFIRNKFASIFDDARQTARNAFNSIINSLNSLLNRIGNGINAMVRAANVIGSIFGFSLPTVGVPHIPQLATGAVVPAHANMLAMIGEGSQKEVVAPEPMLRQLIGEELAKAISNQTITINFTGTGAEIARILKPLIDKENTRIGGSLVTGTVS